MRKLVNKKLLSFFAVGFICMVIGGVAALTVTELDPLKISLFTQVISPAEILAVTKTVLIKQKSVTIELTMTNIGTVQHSANVTVTCYDIDLADIYDMTNVVSDLGAGASVSTTFSFTDAQGVNRLTYNGHDIQILETD